jgi:hypothetical protein
MSYSEALLRVITGRWQAQALYAAVSLGIPDILK